MISFRYLSDEAAEQVKIDMSSFSKLSLAKINRLLKILDEGKRLVTSYEDLDDEERILKDINKELKVSDRDAFYISRFVFNIALLADKVNVIKSFSADLKTLGFSDKEIDKFSYLHKKLKRAKIPKEIRRKHEERKLATEIVPNMSDIEAATDIRYILKGKKIKSAVPVILIQLDLENPEKRVVFQIDLPHLRKMINDLNEIYRRAKVLKLKCV